MLYLTTYISALLLYFLCASSDVLSLKIFPKKILLLAGIVCHSFLVYFDFFLSSYNFDFSNALLLVSLATIFFYFIFNINMQHNGLEKIIIFPAIGILIFHSIFNQDSLMRDSESFFYISHIIVAILGYGLLTYSAVFAIFILLLENDLQKKKIKSFFSTSISILEMEKFLFILIIAGFLMLSITIFTGVFFSKEIFSQPFIFNHKTFFGFAAWILYAYILYRRYFVGLRGRKATKLILLAFIFLILSYFGSKFVIEYILN